MFELRRVHRKHFLISNFYCFAFLFAISFSGCSKRDNSSKSKKPAKTENASKPREEISPSPTPSPLPSPILTPSPGPLPLPSTSPTPSKTPTLRPILKDAEIPKEVLSQHPERVCRIFDDESLAASHQIALTIWNDSRIFFIPSEEILNKLPKNEISRFSRMAYDKLYSEEQLAFDYRTDLWETYVKIDFKREKIPLKFLSSPQAQGSKLSFSLRGQKDKSTRARFYAQGDCRWLEIADDRLSFFSALTLIYKNRAPSESEIDLNQPDARRLALRASVGLGPDDSCTLTDYTFGRERILGIKVGEKAKPLSLLATLLVDKNKVNVFQAWTQSNPNPNDDSDVIARKQIDSLTLDTKVALNSNYLLPSIVATLIPNSREGWDTFKTLFTSFALFGYQKEYDAFEKKMFLLRGRGCKKVQDQSNWLKYVLVTGRSPESNRDL